MRYLAWGRGKVALSNAHRMHLYCRQLWCMWYQSKAYETVYQIITKLHACHQFLRNDDVISKTTAGKWVFNSRYTDRRAADPPIFSDLMFPPHIQPPHALFESLLSRLFEN